MKATHDTTVSDAQLCRERGWTVGTRLAGDEGYGPTVIEITAIGEELILAKAITHRGEPLDLDEDVWTLCCRAWAEVAS